MYNYKTPHKVNVEKKMYYDEIFGFMNEIMNYHLPVTTSGKLVLL